MSNNTSEKLDKIIKRLDILAVILLAQSGLNLKEIADALGVSESTIKRLIPVSKIKGKKGKDITQQSSEPTSNQINEEASTE